MLGGMSPAATLLFAWSAINAYAGLFYGTLYGLRGRRSPEYLAFALLCAAHVGFAIGGAMQLQSADGVEAARYSSIEMASGLVMGAAFFHFAVALTNSRLAAFVPTAWVTMGVGAVATLLGMSVIPSAGDVTRPAGFGIDAPRFEATATVVGIAFGTLAILWSLVGLGTLVRGARDRTEARIVVSAAVPALALASYNQLAHGSSERPGWLVENIGILIALAAGMVLLRRFSRSAVELSARTQALSASYDQLRRTQEELVSKEQLAAVGELSAVIAHEVRNPLAILKNAVSGLRQRALGSGDRRVLLGIVNEETDRLARLVRDLLAYARPLSPTRAPVPMIDLVVRATEDGRLTKVRGDAAIEIDVNESLEVLVDAEHAHHGILNLLDNALAAMNGRGTLHLRAFETRLDGRRAVALEVRDEGGGMDPQILAKARDPFFTTRPSGTGLGLAIVERVARGHDGTLELESVAGVGTTATLTFLAP
jgi:signal transduction histidine kinase